MTMRFFCLGGVEGVFAKAFSEATCRMRRRGADETSLGRDGCCGAMQFSASGESTVDESTAAMLTRVTRTGWRCNQAADGKALQRLFRFHGKASEVRALPPPVPACECSHERLHKRSCSRGDSNRRASARNWSCLVYHRGLLICLSVLETQWRGDLADVGLRGPEAHATRGSVTLPTTKSSQNFKNHQRISRYAKC